MFKLSTRQKLDNIPPTNEIEMFKVRHEPTQHVEPEAENASWRIAFPQGLEWNRCFGPNLEARVVFYKQVQHLGVERIVETMRSLHGIELSEGGVMAILERAGKKAQPIAEEIRKQVIVSNVIKSDETSASHV